MNKIKFIWDYESNSIPICFKKYLQRAKSRHNHKTRFAHRNKLSKIRKFKSTKHGLYCFTNLAISASNELKDIHWFKSIKTRFALVKKLKSNFLVSY